MSEFLGIFKNTRKHIMSGVSYMIPFVVSGGVLFAIAVIMNGQGAVPKTGLPADIWTLGASAMTFMIPILAGFIAFSIADRPGLAPGAAAGYIASTTGAGFLGGLIGGIIAGVVCYYLKKIKLPKSLSSVKSIIIIPVIGVLVAAGIMFWVIGAPIAVVMKGLTAWLTHMSSSNRIILGIICGAMTAFDMGGPVNKVSYAFCVATVSAGIYTYAGPSAAAVCIPPLGMALATFLAPKKYTSEEKEAGKAALAMGCVGITEGAIPFAANDPIRVIPCLMVGDAVGTVTAFLFNTTCTVAWGGFIVLPAITNKFGWVISVVIGAVVVALLVNLVKKPVTEKHTENKDEDIDISFE
jgi:fructose-specific PTS system IIC-like component